MKILVLGSGGRALCRQCAASAPAARELPSRRPGAIAISDDHDRWLLLSAAPEIARHALVEAAALEGRLVGIVLLDAQLEHAASLAALSRTRPIALYATPGVFEELTARLPLLGAPPFGGDLRWHLLPVAGDVRSTEFLVDGMDMLRCIAIDDGGGSMPHAPHRREPVVGDELALLVEDRRSGQRLVYAPGSGADALPWMEGADCLLVSGSNCPLEHGDAAGDARLAALGARRTVLVHLVDCDPRLQEDSQAHRAAQASGLEIARDGMEITL